MQMKPVSRRNLLRAGLVGAGAAVVARDMPAAKATSKKFVVDVAWLGQTTRVLPMPPMNPAALDLPGAFRGWAVYMEGSIYDNGTIPGEPEPGKYSHDFDPRAATAPAPMGTCFGWGYVVEDLDRSPSTDPTLILTVQYVFGIISPTSYFPPNQLVSSGLEFAHTDQRQPSIPSQPVTQPVTGGSGEFAGANGVVVKRYIGTNKSAPDDGAHAARNYRIAFTI